MLPPTEFEQEVISEITEEWTISDQTIARFQQGNQVGMRDQTSPEVVRRHEDGGSDGVLGRKERREEPLHFSWGIGKYGDTEPRFPDRDRRLKPCEGTAWSERDPKEDHLSKTGSVPDAQRNPPLGPNEPMEDLR